MAITLPLRNDLMHYSFECRLDNNSYGFEFWWNERAQIWFMSVFASDGTPIATGLRMIVGFPLMSRCRKEERPPGVLLAVDTAGRHEEPGVSDLGARVQLIYYGENESFFG